MDISCRFSFRRILSIFIPFVMVAAASGQPVPAYVVTVNTDDSSGVNGYGVASNCTGTTPTNCSLRDALAAAMAAGGGNITFDPTVFAATQPVSARTITLTPSSGEIITSIPLSVPSNTTITGLTTGSGATLTTLVTVNGGGYGPVFYVLGTNVAISGLTITGGSSTAGGGGIGNYGVLTVSDCTISGNAVYQYGVGAGIANYGTLMLINSTITDNTANGTMPAGPVFPPYAVAGAGIFNEGTLTLINSTVAGNTLLASGDGSGIYNEGELTVTGSTITANSFQNGATGAAISIGAGTLTITNSIVAGNGTDCSGSGCPTNGTNGNITGVSPGLPTFPIVSNYGGPTQTAPPLPSSPAICGGIVADIPAGVSTDQRGFPRTTTYGSNPPCVDSGAVQTDYSLAFSAEPPASVPLNTNFAAGLQLSESGSPFPYSGVAIPLALGEGDPGSLNVSSLTTNASGTAASSQLQVSAEGTGDTLVAALPLTATPPPPPLTSPIGITATSSPFDVVASPSTTTLTASATSAAIGTSVTFTATVSSSVTSPAPTGTVQFYDGSTMLGPAVTLAAGSASYSTASLAEGTHTITAVYSGDANFSSSTSAALTEHIVMAASTTTLAASATSVTIGTSVTFTATVSSSLTSPAPTGTVQFYDGSTPLGAAVTLAAGSATYTTSSLAAGTHTITAVYSGDANFSSSTSVAVTENVEGMMSALGATSASVAPGGSVTETLTVTALGGLNEATTFACSGLPSGATCSFNPASVTGSGSTTMTLSTTGNSAALAPESRWLRGGGIVLAGILVLLWPIRRRRWAQMLGILLLCFVFSATGCGGGSSGHGGGGGGGGGSSGTPAGTYTITVTTTTGSGTSAITDTLTFQLTVT